MGIEYENKPIHKIGLIWDERMLSHSEFYPDSKKKSYQHCENPKRLSFVIDQLQKNGITKDCDFVEKFELCHKDYINKAYKDIPHFEKMSELHQKLKQERLENPSKKKPFSKKNPQENSNKEQVEWLNGDVYVNPDTFLAMHISASAVKQATDKVMKGEWHSAFAEVRPPGHHACLEGTPSGFCFFNNIAIAAKYLQREYKVNRILIFDWDVHHGDGTQNFFNDDPNVMFVSIHQYDEGNFFPFGLGGNCAWENSGTGEAKGTKINFPWNVNCKSSKQHKFEIDRIVTDDDYLFIFELVILPIIKSFQPEFIFISAGFDSCIGDLLGQLHCSPIMFAKITNRLREICPKVVLASEGGYTYEN